MLREYNSLLFYFILYIYIIMDKYVIIPFLIHFSSFWLFCGLFYYYDKKFINKSINNREKYKKAIRISLLNQLCITLPLLYLSRDIIKNIIIIADNYSLTKNMINIFLIGNLSNIFFYSIHRLFHLNYFYKKIHTVHHEFVEPVAPSSLYAHPIEHIFANTMPFLLAYFICGGCSYNITLGLLCIGSFVTTSAHVNHDIKILGREHLYHHKFYKYNFGFGRYLDRLFRTNYNKYLQNNNS